MNKTLLSVLLLGCVCILQAYDLKNPALNKVEFKQAEKHAPIELIKNGVPQFALIADLHKEKGSVRGRSLRLAVDEWKLAIKKGTGKDLEVFRSSQIPEAKKKYFNRSIMPASIDISMLIDKYERLIEDI